MERKERVSPWIASIFSRSKLLKSSPESEDEEHGAACLWTVLKTSQYHLWGNGAEN